MYGAKCGAITVGDNEPGHNGECVGVVTRPLIAKVVGINWYYGFDASMAKTVYAD